MSEKTSFEQEMEKIIQLVKEAETDNFFELAKILGRNPKKDFAGADLHNCDLSGGDLRRADLRRTNLSSANLKGAKLRGADLSFADLSGADFTGADLRGTIFDNVRAENAIFCNNVGLYERLRLDLIDKGARFVNTEDIPANRTSGETDMDEYDLREQLNLRKFEEIHRSQRQFNLHENKFIAIWNGEVIASEDYKARRDQKIETFLLQHPEYSIPDILQTQITKESNMPIDV